jgi:hypothetical protein
MSLRDYFAAAALAHRVGSVSEMPEDVAKWCFAVADAMLKLRDND